MRILYATIITLMLSHCCGDSRSENEMRDDEARHCATIDSVRVFGITFRGFFPNELDSVRLTLKHYNDTLIDTLSKVPTEISDSSRHIRNIDCDMVMHKGDSLIIYSNNLGRHLISGFYYEVAYQYTKFCPGFGCSPMIIVDGDTTWDVQFYDDDIWKLEQTKDYRDYYKENSN